MNTNTCYESKLVEHFVKFSFRDSLRKVVDLDAVSSLANSKSSFIAPVTLCRM